MIRKDLLVLTCMLLTGGISGNSSKWMDLPDLVHPAGMVLWGDRLFISDQAEILRYDVKTRKSLGRFGRDGDGPGEFRIHTNLNNGGVFLFAGPNGLFATSLGRLSRFDWQGKVRKIWQTRSRGYRFVPVPGGYFGLGVSRNSEGTEFHTLNLYSPEFEPRQELHRQEIWNEINRLDPILFTFFPAFTVSNGRIFIADLSGTIWGFDTGGRRLHRFDHHIPARAVTGRDRQVLEQFLNRDHGYRGFLDKYHSIVKFGDHFPPVRAMVSDGRHLFVIPFALEKGRQVCYVYNAEGRFERRSFITVPEMSPIRLCPFTVSEGLLYELRLNVEQDRWELHREKIIP